MGRDDFVYELLRDLGLSEGWARTSGVLTGILLVALAAIVLARVADRLVRRSVRGLVARSTLRNGGPASTSRAETLAGVAASVVRILVWSVAALLAVEQLGVNVAPVLAGASIVGVALGFGAQSLVRDFLSGFFILAEDQFVVGDVITVMDVTGTVEDVNLRVTRLRAADGTVWFVPNGEIRKVGNAAKGWAVALVDMALPVSADVQQARTAIGEEVAGMAGDERWAEVLLEEPEVLGVESMGADGYTVRVSVRTRPADRARVARELRARLGDRLRREGLLVAKVAEGPATPAG